MHMEVPRLAANGDIVTEGLRMASTPRLRSELIHRAARHFDRSNAEAQFLWARLLHGLARQSPHETSRILHFLGRHVREEQFAPDPEGRTRQAARILLGKTLLKIVQNGRAGDVVRFVQARYPDADALAKSHGLAAVQAVTRRRMPDLAREMVLRRLNHEPEAGRRRYPEYADRIVRMATRHVAEKDPFAKQWRATGLEAADWAGPASVVDLIEHGFKGADGEQREAMALLLLRHADSKQALRVVDLASALGRRHPEFKVKMTLVLARAHLHAQHMDDDALRLAARNAMERVQFRKPGGAKKPGER